MKKLNNDEDKEYYVATRDEAGELLVYCSEAYKLSEIDLINLIKICLIEERSKSIGRRILSAYRDSNSYRKDIIHKRLELIGIKNDESKIPERLKNGRTK